jgi:hypothetical protein
MVRRTIRISSSAALLCLLLLSSSISLFAQDANPTEEPLAAAAVDAKNELLVIEINRKVTTKDRGFPRNDPPRKEANGNWRTPVNYAEGTMYYRVEIRKQPQPQNMRLQFCIWQDNFRLESCGSQKSVSGKSGTVVTWSQPVTSMWKKGGKSIDWSRPRQRYGIAIKNSKGKPISDYNGWRWNGANPSQWYPLDMRFTVVVVAKGAQFSGWQNYGGNTSDNALLAADEAPISSEDGNDLNFGSGMDFSLWETESATDAADIEDDAGDLQDTELENKLYLPMIPS